MEYYTTYRDEWETPATSLALALIKDVYNLDVLPLLACGRLMRDQESMDLIGDELFELLCEYGGMNIVFHDKKTRVPRKVTRDIVINHELFLTKKALRYTSADIFPAIRRGHGGAVRSISRDIWNTHAQTSLDLQRTCKDFSECSETRPSQTTAQE